MTTYKYPRRAKKQLTPEILAQWQALIMKGDLPGFEKMLSKYQDHIDPEVKRELIDEFNRRAVSSLARRWRSSR